MALSKFSRYLWPLPVLALPLVLLVSAVLTFRELQEMRAIYLRSRAGALAARLETLQPRLPEEKVVDALRDEEPALLDIRIFDTDHEGRERAFLDPIWQGRELFRIELLTAEGGEIFRAYIPFHSEGRLRIARIDLAASAADYLVSHARHNVVVASLSGLVLVLLSLYAIWSSRRAARLERRQLKLEHLAHLGMMSAVLAHEIRNPLGTIKGFAQLAAEKAEAATAPLLAPILDEIRRLERLVSDLLMYGRPPEPALRWTEWESIASALTAQAREAIGNRSIRFRAQPDGLRLRTDPDLLKAALLNLVRNSIEALDDAGDGEVRLAAAPASGGGLVISVEDNGPGLSAAARARLFEPFFTTKAFGTGLGLPIARRLLSELGGELSLGSAAPRGAKAEVLFRRMEVQAPDAECNPA
ncbi:MAG: ATP-binding protein [Acidobacteriota bacterium]